MLSLGVCDFLFEAYSLASLLTALTCLDDETSMQELEDGVRAIQMDGLVWGASKLVPVGFGIKKLQINLVVEDEKVSLTDLQEMIEGDEDHVQSTDVVSLFRSISAVCGRTLTNFFLLGCYAKVVSDVNAFRVMTGQGKLVAG
jgi:translation elongation factor EF-1beta